MYCQSCGKKIENAVKFCSHCGASISVLKDTPDQLQAPQEIAMNMMSLESSKAVLVCAFGLLAAFFMPWVQLFGFSMSGYNLGRLGSYGNYAWVIPILAGATILLSFIGANNRGIGAIAGIVPLGAILYGLIRLGGEGGGNATKGVLDMAGQVLSIGAWLTIIFSIVIIIAAKTANKKVTSGSSINVDTNLGNPTIQQPPITQTVNPQPQNQQQYSQPQVHEQPIADIGEIASKSINALGDWVLNNKKGLFITGSALVVLIAALIIIPIVVQRSTWVDACKKNTEAAYNEYINKYPQGKYVAEAIAAKKSAMFEGAKKISTLEKITPAKNKCPFRDKPATLSDEEVKTMLAKYGFYNSDWSKDGKGVTHRYKPETIAGGEVVHDEATGLTWQQSGLDNSITYTDAEKYIDGLNAREFAGYSDWRLPTLEEAMSLMEREKMDGDLYIDPRFDDAERWIWTADKYSAELAWSVNFLYGYCYYHYLGNFTYVRAVR